MGNWALKKHYWELRSALGDFSLRRTVALAAGVRDFVRERITVGRAEEEIKKALESREERFLALARSQIYERPQSPYLRLLKIAGCEFSDLQTQVQRHGVEGTLERLAREGVYLTSEEFKGKKEVVRGGQSFWVSPEDFEPAHLSPGYIAQSSGTTNQPVRAFVPLEWLAVRAFSVSIFLAAHNLFSYAHALYDAILPGGGGIGNLLTYAKLGIAADRWFARKIPLRTRLESAYQYLTTYVIVLAAKWYGPGFPRPELIDLREIHRIVHWVSDQKRKGKGCCVMATASNAARIARVAWEMGVSLEGTKFSVGGEPLTKSKREVIERVGATTTSRYNASGMLNYGLGCANPIHTDEMHVNQHLFAMVPHPKPLTADGPPIHPLLCTTLHPSASRLHFNVENGDYATLERRDCGCALERVGFTLHLHRVRSFEKFTSEGMNYFYGDLFELFEKVLPGEFGGGPGDYQLVEEEDGAGQTRLTLVVHPEVGAVDEARLLARLREALAEGSWGNQFRTRLWQAAGTFRLARRVPHASPRGKILPLHIPH